MLTVIEEALNELSINQLIPIRANDRVVQYAAIVKDAQFSRKDYHAHFNNISLATASRDLKEAVEKGILEKEGDKNTSIYKYKKN